MTSGPDLTPILEDLAAGRIDPAEAARRIDAAKAAGSSAAEPLPHRAVPGSAPEPPAKSAATAEPAAERIVPPRRTGGSKGVERVSVRAVGRRVRIVGDAAVAAVAVDGPHVMRRHGSVLEITSEGDLGPNLDGFSLLRPPRDLDVLKAIGLGKELLLRVNPSITVDAEVTAGSLNTERLPYLGKVRVTAGGAGLHDVAEFDDVLVQAGSASIRGLLVTGRSRVRCESGSLSIELDERSNVTVRGEANLGKIFWSEAHDAEVDEVVLGNGSARLDVGVVMGFATIKADETKEG